MLKPEHACREERSNAALCQTLWHRDSTSGTAGAGPPAVVVIGAPQPPPLTGSPLQRPGQPRPSDLGRRAARGGGRAPGPGRAAAAAGRHLRGALTARARARAFDHRLTARLLDGPRGPCAPKKNRLNPSCRFVCLGETRPTKFAKHVGGGRQPPPTLPLLRASAPGHRLRPRHHGLRPGGAPRLRGGRGQHLPFPGGSCRGGLIVPTTASIIVSLQ
jgi:hypothetical protein